MLVANQADMSHGIWPTRRIKMASGVHSILANPLSILHYFSTKISCTRRFLFQSIMNARRYQTPFYIPLHFHYFANNLQQRKFFQRTDE